MKTDKCRSCGRHIIWTVTKTGKRMPVDAEPVEDGNLVLKELRDGRIRAVYASESEPLLITGERYTSHFATCPQAGMWRR